MRTVATCILSLFAATALALAIGHGPTLARWGEAGVQSMRAVSVICLAAALCALIPMGFVALKWPGHIGQAALGATVLRLLLTMAAIAAYQTLAEPHMASFLMWAVIVYCLLLAVETGFGVYLVHRYYRPPSAAREATT